MTRGRNGFSLVELLLVLALLGLTAMLCLPLMGHGDASALTADARSLAARLRAARELALAQRRDTAVVLDLASPGIAGPEGSVIQPLAATERMRVVTAKGPVAAATATLRFAPGGGSSGGVVILESGALRRTVTIAWLTGTVTIGADAP